MPTTQNWPNFFLITDSWAWGGPTCCWWCWTGSRVGGAPVGAWNTPLRFTIISTRKSYNCNLIVKLANWCIHSWLYCMTLKNIDFLDRTVILSATYFVRLECSNLTFFTLGADKRTLLSLLAKFPFTPLYNISHTHIQEKLYLFSSVLLQSLGTIMPV